MTVAFAVVNCEWPNLRGRLSDRSDDKHVIRTRSAKKEDEQQRMEAALARKIYSLFEELRKIEFCQQTCQPHLRCTLGRAFPHFQEPYGCSKTRAGPL